MQLSNEMSQLLNDRLALQPSESQTKLRLNDSPHLTTLNLHQRILNNADNSPNNSPR